MTKRQENSTTGLYTRMLNNENQFENLKKKHIKFWSLEIFQTLTFYDLRNLVDLFTTNQWHNDF